MSQNFPHIDNVRVKNMNIKAELSVIRKIDVSLFTLFFSCVSFLPLSLLFLNTENESESAKYLFIGITIVMSVLFLFGMYKLIFLDNVIRVADWISITEKEISYQKFFRVPQKANIDSITKIRPISNPKYGWVLGFQIHINGEVVNVRKEHKKYKEFYTELISRIPSTIIENNQL